MKSSAGVHVEGILDETVPDEGEEGGEPIGGRVADGGHVGVEVELAGDELKLEFTVDGAEGAEDHYRGDVGEGAVEGVRGWDAGVGGGRG